MIFPIIQLVSDELLETLRRIRKVSGFQTNPTVQLVSFDEEPLGENDATIVFNLEGFEDASETPIGFTDQIHTFRLGVLVPVSARSTPDKPALSLHNRMLLAAADVERAVLQDPSRGGNAINTELTTAAIIDARQLGYYGIDLYVACHIRHALDEPASFQPFQSET